MSDFNPSQPAPRLVSAGMVDEWSYLLPGPDRSAFVAACAEAEADDRRLQAVLSRYFSTWKTSLMADDLSRLQMLATYVQIRDYIKVICLEDDTEFEETSPSESSAIWPRHEDGQVVAEALGVGLLKSMLAARQLCPDRLEIRDKHTIRERSDPETAAILARNILDGADLAVTDFVLRKESAMTTFIAAELSTEHQGQGTKFSILRKAEICLSHNLNSNSYWADQILLHAPVLKELSLSFSQPSHMPHTPSFILHNTTLPALEKLEISMASLSVPTIMTILSKSKQSLTGIKFRLTTLVNNSTWAELLNRICNEFPNLTWFELTNLSEGPNGGLRITFLGLEKDSVVGEPYKNGLKLGLKSPVGGNKRIPWVEYGGPDANHVLRIVAQYAVAKPVP
ncbi:hypothetical protein BGW36DRAFT_392039 [Talaromyces proteolyticus]|uniref:Uncharacterized protein n=1 Tax=Talaromyces proteolyticus TaxID=1131652 RepID=A0AAD4KG42_9EURO|nr:uncharacterized protein BGW36DRAFT_392039 [Talaromyces proteolyticus]KAH8688691.1 hypothetical protein BGW36DRAFT_392039 [Talaromyces proteolyticus]